MASALVRGFERVSKWWHWGLAFGLFLVVLTIIGTQVGRFEEITNGVPMMEVPEVVSRDLYAVASSYPEAAVRIYQQVLQPLDILLPITAGLWFAIGLAVLTTRLFPAGSTVHVVSQLDSEPDSFLGFPLRDDQDHPAHKEWLDDLQVAFSSGHRVSIEYKLTGGNNQLIRHIQLLT